MNSERSSAAEMTSYNEPCKISTIIDIKDSFELQPIPGSVQCCMQDTFARARTRPMQYAAARPSARATIGYLVYNKAVDSSIL